LPLGLQSNSNPTLQPLLKKEKDLSQILIHSEQVGKWLMVENATFSMGGRDTYDPILASEFSFSISAPNNNIITHANKIGKKCFKFSNAKKWERMYLCLALKVPIISFDHCVV